MPQVSQQEFPGGAPQVNQFPGNPFGMTGLLVSALQSKFSRSENLWQPSLRGDPRILWQPDTDERIEGSPPRSPSIYIGTPFSFRPEQAEVAPAILVRRQTHTLGSRMSMGDKFQSTRNLLGDVDSQHVATVGVEQLMVVMHGSHDVLCVASSRDAEALDALACEVYSFLVMHQLVIRRASGLVEFRVEGLGPVSELDGAFQGRWACSVGVRYTQHMSWLLRHGGPVLKGFDVQSSDPDSPMLRE